MIEVVCAVICERERVLVVQRPPGGRHGGCWELPGGKVESGEEPAVALARELAEELGIAAVVGARVGAAEDGRIRLSAFLVPRYRGVIALRAHRALRWVTATEGAALDLPEADRAIWAVVCETALAEP